MWIRVIAFYLIGFLPTMASFAQDLEPRSFSRIPTGVNVVMTSYGYSNGNILLNNNLPIEDLVASQNSFTVGYARSFKLFNRLTKFDGLLPVSHAHYKGEVSLQDATTNQAGLGDPSLRLTMVLVGTKPMRTADFLKTELKNHTFGIVMRIRLPLGQYDADKLINLGANRWGFKFGTAGSYRVGKYVIVEAHFNTWIFTENKDFLSGNKLKQKPLLSGQLHATYIFKLGISLSGSFGLSGLGETFLNGEARDDRQLNFKFGATFNYAIKAKHVINLSVTNALVTNYGNGITTVGVGYNFLWTAKE